ncbi:MAG: hypothetical protein ACRDZ4_19905 [Egibacteraceae bacterium]
MRWTSPPSCLWYRVFGAEQIQVVRLQEPDATTVRAVAIVDAKQSRRESAVQ